MHRENPFNLVRAAEYTDEQVNDLWVESAIEQIIEPRSSQSKFILGGKGTGKTHLLRYFSYRALRLRSPRESGFETCRRCGFIAIYLRASNLDSSRFEAAIKGVRSWQLFSVYLELQLVESLLDAMCDILSTSATIQLNTANFLTSLLANIEDPSVASVTDIQGFRDWAIKSRRRIDHAINSAAFSGSVDISAPFTAGKFAVAVSNAVRQWHASLADLSVVFMIDEIENLTELQQQVVNSLIRYSEGAATIRVTGRLYGVKTHNTIAGGEPNREGSEFTTVVLDHVLRSHEKSKYPTFARLFFAKRLASVGEPIPDDKRADDYFESLGNADWYDTTFRKLGFEPSLDAATTNLYQAIIRSAKGEEPLGAAQVLSELTSNLPPILQKLNILQFCKRAKGKSGFFAVARQIKLESEEFVANPDVQTSYSRAYSHYGLDLFAQLCRESRHSVPYAGFETFIRMSSGNPRNLLVLLARTYNIAAFKGDAFSAQEPLSVDVQTAGATESASFLFDSDSNYGRKSDDAREVVDRVATLLRTARYAMNIPEVSPLMVSFADSDLNSRAHANLEAALNYSLLCELKKGRPDRNSHQVHRKIFLNPLLSPRWGLPVSRRGDVFLSMEEVNAIFDTEQRRQFIHLLSLDSERWNNPFAQRPARLAHQRKLFDQ